VRRLRGEICEVVMMMMTRRMIVVKLLVSFCTHSLFVLSFILVRLSFPPLLASDIWTTQAGLISGCITEFEDIPPVLFAKMFSVELFSTLLYFLCSNVLHPTFPGKELLLYIRM